CNNAGTCRDSGESGAGNPPGPIRDARGTTFAPVANRLLQTPFLKGNGNGVEIPTYAGLGRKLSPLDTMENNTAPSDRHTPGPWAWFGNAKHNTIYLATTHSGRRYV